MFSDKTQLKRIRLSELKKNCNNFIVVGVIIAKEEPRNFNDEENKSSDSAFWNFVLRDSPYYYANVLCLGPKQCLLELHESFRFGDVVSVKLPKVEMEERFDSAMEFCRFVRTRFTLVLKDELYSKLVKYEGNHVPYLDLVRFVTKPISDATSIAEILNFNTKHTGIDVIGCVKIIGKVEDITTSSNVTKQSREIVIVDQTSAPLRVFFFNPEILARTETWQAGVTILFIINVSCKWSNRLGSIVACTTSRSIVTEDPIAPEIVGIRKHMHRMPHSALIDTGAIFTGDVSTIQNVMSVHGILHKAKIIMAVMKTSVIENPQFTTILCALVTELDFHGLSRLITLEWSNHSCKISLGNSNLTSTIRCTSPEQEHNNTIVTFDLRLILTDQSGSLFNCRLSGPTAEKILDCTVDQYLQMDDRQKISVEDKLLMQIRKFYLHVMAIGIGNPTISILKAEMSSSAENWEDSMDEEETEEASLTESAAAIGDGGAYADIRKHTDMKGNDSNENEATTESASANKEGGIGKSTDSNQKHFKAPLGEAKKSKRKAIDMDEIERRMKEAYDIIKQSQNTDPPKTTLCTAYGQLVTQRLETLSELQRTIVMYEIDNLFFRTTIEYLGPQYQSTSPGPVSPASFYSSSSDETFHTTPSIASLLTINPFPQHSATSSGHQPSRAPVIPTPTDNDIQYLPSGDNYTCL
ncbi:hypothetical protein FQA39_LY11189 [Lamprigera yunnana]|nr:hypothetical protein FQA39_LY11189 [Lamprigera yunnana]